MHQQGLARVVCQVLPRPPSTIVDPRRAAAAAGVPRVVVAEHRWGDLSSAAALSPPFELIAACGEGAARSSKGRAATSPAAGCPATRINRTWQTCAAGIDVALPPETHPLLLPQPRRVVCA
jgi:hypothetical protein